MDVIRCKTFKKKFSNCLLVAVLQAMLAICRGVYMKRLDKFLVEMSVASRSTVKDMAKKGRITVNGEVVKASDVKIDENMDVVSVDGQVIAFSDMEYFMLNKPAGVITATLDKKAKTVLDLIDERTRNDLFPVGRLDKDTEGLLLITNDGDLAHRLLAPKKHVDKIYYADIDGIVTDEHVRRFAEGLTLLDGTQVMPGELTVIETDMAKNTSKIQLTIHEGKFHQVKRMFEAVGCSVTYLKRLSMGPLELDAALAPGEYRRLTDEEINMLKEATA